MRVFNFILKQKNHHRFNSHKIFIFNSNELQLFYVKIKYNNYKRKKIKTAIQISIRFQCQDISLHKNNKKNCVLIKFQ